MTSYIISVTTLAAITAIFCLGVNISWGWVGQLDLAFYAYVALGAYMTAVFQLPPAKPQVGLLYSYILGLRWPFPVALVAAAVVTGLAAALVGAIALRRLRSDYIAIITAVTALMITAVFGQVATLFGGQIGLYGLSSPFNSILNLSGIGYTYFYLALSLVALAVVYVAVEALGRSPFGRSLRAVREEDLAAAAFGRNLFTLRLRAYVTSAVVGSIGGSLLVNYVAAWNPSSWNLFEVVLLLSAVIVGGRGNARGAIVGSIVVLTLLPEVTRLVPLLGGNAEQGSAVGTLLGSLLIILILRYRRQGVIPERLVKDNRSQADLGMESPQTAPTPSAGGKVS